MDIHWIDVQTRKLSIENQSLKKVHLRHWNFADFKRSPLSPVVLTPKKSNKHELTNHLRIYWYCSIFSQNNSPQDIPKKSRIVFNPFDSRAFLIATWRSLNIRSFAKKTWLKRPTKSDTCHGLLEDRWFLRGLSGKDRWFGDSKEVLDFRASKEQPWDWACIDW